MWLLYQDTDNEKYLKIARKSEEKLQRCFPEYYGLHHDIGFVFVPTAIADYKLTGNPESRKLGMHAANLLVGRFKPAGRFIRS